MGAGGGEKELRTNKDLPRGHKQHEVHKPRHAGMSNRHAYISSRARVLLNRLFLTHFLLQTM